MIDDSRYTALVAWLQSRCGLRDCRIETASGDASFRRYFRVHCAGAPVRIVMDAPPAREHPGDFVRIAGRLRAIGVHAPEVFAADLEQGFVLLEDLGDRLYLDVLDDTNADRLYGDALTALIAMQTAAPADDLPVYDHTLLMREMGLFSEWLLGRHLGIAPDRGEQALLDAVYGRLAENALAQPCVFVHRDFHARNLMETSSLNPGVLDFQDAVRGPVAYDLVSLLKDCYLAWPPDRVQGWVHDYVDRAVTAGVLDATQAAEFPRWFDLLGVQRHLKAAGIFARLQHRDGKPGYLADIPRTLGYIVESAAQHAEIADLADFIARRVLPRCAA